MLAAFVLKLKSLKNLAPKYYLLRVEFLGIGGEGGDSLKFELCVVSKSVRLSLLNTLYIEDVNAKICVFAIMFYNVVAELSE